MLMNIVPGCPTDSVRRLIDADFEAWMNSITPASRPCRPPIGRPHVEPSRQRKADYSRVQTLFRRNKSRCAREVLAGTWSFARALAGLPELEHFWRGIFEKESKPDIRKPDPVGPILWEIVAPVLMPELEQTIAQVHQVQMYGGPQGTAANK